MTPLVPCFAPPLTPFRLVYSLFMTLFFFSLCAHAFFFPPLPLILAFRSVFETLLFCFPLSPVFFTLSSVFRGVEASNSVTVLCCLCVFVPECVSVCGPLQTGKEISYTIALWLYNSCRGVILTAKEAPFVYSGRCRHRAPCTESTASLWRTFPTLEGSLWMLELHLTYVTYHPRNTR